RQDVRAAPAAGRGCRWTELAHCRGFRTADEGQAEQPVLLLRLLRQHELSEPDDLVPRATLDLRLSQRRRRDGAVLVHPQDPAATVQARFQKRLPRALRWTAGWAAVRRRCTDRRNARQDRDPDHFAPAQP